MGEWGLAGASGPNARPAPGAVCFHGQPCERGPMSILTAVPLLLLLADDAPAPAWKFVEKNDGITLMKRERPGSEVIEYKVNGMVDAPPAAVFKIVSDMGAYKKINPYIEATELRLTEQDGKVQHLYVLSAAPMVSKRDYTLRFADESDWQDGKGFLKLSFKTSDKGPPVKEGIIRMTVYEGEWILEPREDGKKTFATHALFTDPAGAIPKWIVNMLASDGLKDLLKNVRKAAA